MPAALDLDELRAAARRRTRRARTLTVSLAVLVIAVAGAGIVLGVHGAGHARVSSTASTPPMSYPDSNFTSAGDFARASDAVASPNWGLVGRGNLYVPVELVRPPGEVRVLGVYPAHPFRTASGDGSGGASPSLG